MALSNQLFSYTSSELKKSQYVLALCELSQKFVSYKPNEKTHMKATATTVLILLVSFIGKSFILLDKS